MKFMTPASNMDYVKDDWWIEAWWLFKLNFYLINPALNSQFSQNKIRYRIPGRNSPMSIMDVCRRGEKKMCSYVMMSTVILIIIMMVMVTKMMMTTMAG